MKANNLAILSLFIAWLELVSATIVGECGDPNDTLLHTKEYISDSTLETSPPYFFFRGQVRTDPFLAFGLICGPDVPTAASLFPDFFSFSAPLDFQCSRYNAGVLGRYNESGQVLISEFFSPSLQGLSFRIRTYTPNRKFTHIRFWSAHRFADELNTGPPAAASVGIFILGFGGADFRSMGSFTPINTSECPGLGAWRRYDIPIDQVDEAIESKVGSAGYEAFEVLISVPGLDSVLAVDNIELVNLNGTDRVDPPPEGTNRLKALGLLEQTTCPPSFLDSFAVIAISLISLCFFGFCVTAIKYSDSRGARMDTIWFVVSVALSAMAVFELQDFEEKLASLASCIDGINRALVNASTIIHPPELRENFDVSQSSAFGAFRLVLPPYDPIDIPSLFSLDGLVGNESNGCAGSNCIQCSIPTSTSSLFQKFCDVSATTCVSNMTDFLRNSDPEVDFQGRVGLFTIEGEITSSQSHWIDLLLIAFIVDTVLSVVHILFRSIIRRSFREEQTRSKFVFLLNVCSLIVSVSFTGYILWSTFVDPIRYEAQFFLKRSMGDLIGGVFEEELGIFVCPKLLVNEDKSNVFIDLGAVKSIFKRFAQVQLMLSALLIQADQELLEIAPSGLATSTALCPLESVQQTVSSGNISYTITCDGDTRVPLLPEAAAKQQQDFIFYTVFLGLVMVDFLITFVDVLSLGVLVYHIRRLMKAPLKDTLKT